MQETGLAQLFIIVAFAVTIWRLTRTLPGQNVIACVTLTICISSLAEIFGAKTGIPFGPFFYTENPRYSALAPLHLVFRLKAAPNSLNLPWPIPLLWVVVLFNSRGTARLILKPWRSDRNYGIWLLALTCLLVVLFDAALEPVATRVNHWWIWMTPGGVPSWYGAPWINFAGRAVTSLLIFGLITPWLINKKPVAEPPPDIYTLGIWLTLLFLLALASAVHHLWPAMAFTTVTAAISGFIAWRNSR